MKYEINEFKKDGYTMAEIKTAIEQHERLRQADMTDEENNNSVAMILYMRRKWATDKTQRDITSTTYERAQKRLQKQVESFLKY